MVYAGSAVSKSVPKCLKYYALFIIELLNLLTALVTFHSVTKLFNSYVRYHIFDFYWKPTFWYPTLPLKTYRDIYNHQEFSSCKLQFILVISVTV